MKDLRPKLADEFVSIILEELRLELSTDRRTRLVEKVLAAFVAHDIPAGEPGAVAAFRAKYPEVDPTLAWIEHCAAEVWPGVPVMLHLEGEYDACPTCAEGQRLHVYVGGRMARAVAEAEAGAAPRKETEAEAEVEFERWERFLDLICREDLELSSLVTPLL